MLYRNRIASILFLLLLALAVTACKGKETAGIPDAGAQETVISTEKLDINALANSSGNSVLVNALGVTMEDEVDSAEFTTSIVTATHPFNYVVPEWTADIPEGSRIDIQVRTAPLEGEWSDWHTIVLDPDTSEPENDFYSGSFDDGGDALTFNDRVQLNVEFHHNDLDEKPVVQDMALVFIDSTNGPTTQQILTDMRANESNGKLRQQTTYRKPNVITRQQWCTHASCNYSAGISHFPVSHLIVHHTVSNNATTDWAANVRAIWTYHTFSRGWGDVGYNYLIDPNGNIYEGHKGGDNVIGTHASAANRGGMGVALLGTFSTSEVPEPMKAALVELLAWKADVADIDLWDASRMPLLDWGNLHLIGHRDVYGTTACPGDLAHGDLAEIRRRVDAKLGRTNPYSYIDELTASFSVSNANWYNGPKNCGFNAHSYYTFATDQQGQSTNTGTWNINVSTSGRYAVDAFVPFCATGEDDVRTAQYAIQGSNGKQTKQINQQDNLGLWVSLGQFDFAVGGTNQVVLSDLTNNEGGTPIWFDALRVKPLDNSGGPIISPLPSVVLSSPAQESFVTDETVTFDWRTTSAETITELRLQVALDPAFSNTLVDRVLSSTIAESATEKIGGAHENLYWRIVAKTATGNIVTSDAIRFRYDASSPQSEITAVYRQCNGDISLVWEGSDAISGIKHYDIAYRSPGSSSWTTVLNDTTLTEFTFTPPDQNGGYRFRAQAVDNQGNSEPLKPDGDIGDESIVPCNINPPINSSPSGDEWLTNRRVNFSWDIEHKQAVRDYTFEVANDSSFNDIVVRETISGDQRQLQVTFNDDFAQRYWRVMATTHLESTFYSQPSSIRMDATAPESDVFNSHQLANGDYQIFWRGEDSGSGLVNYTVEYLSPNGSNWNILVENTTETTAIFSPPDRSAKYLFRSRATDAAGNVEAGKPAGDFDTARGCPYIDEAPKHVSPGDETWRSSREIVFRWDAPGDRCTTESGIEISADNTFRSALAIEVFEEARSSFQYIADNAATELWWRATHTTVLGETFTSEPALVRFETNAPTSQVVSVLGTGSGYIIVADGSDAQSGIQGYMFEYRRDNSNEWIRWSGGNGNSALFVPPEDGVRYWFRSFAIDEAGNVEPADSNGDLSTSESTDASRVFIPIVQK